MAITKYDKKKTNNKLKSISCMFSDNIYINTPINEYRNRQKQRRKAEHTGFTAETEECWLAWSTGETRFAVWLAEDSQGWLLPTLTGACICDIGWNWEMKPTSLGVSQKWTENILDKKDNNNK